MKDTLEATKIITVEQFINDVKHRWLKKCKFKCVSCGNIQTWEDFEEAWVDRQMVYQECIWRHKEWVWCNRALYWFLQFILKL